MHEQNISTLCQTQQNVGQSDLSHTQSNVGRFKSDSTEIGQSDLS